MEDMLRLHRPYEDSTRFHSSRVHLIAKRGWAVAQATHASASMIEALLAREYGSQQSVYTRRTTCIPSGARNVHCSELLAF
jgi:hypothetical protein